MRSQLSLPVVANTKVAPKYKAHGSSIASLIDEGILVSLGVKSGG